MTQGDGIVKTVDLSLTGEMGRMQHLRTGQDRTGQDRTGQDRTGQDNPVFWLCI